MTHEGYDVREEAERVAAKAERESTTPMGGDLRRTTHRKNSLLRTLLGNTILYPFRRLFGKKR